jgi:methylmalonyl-CoA mutase
MAPRTSDPLVLAGEFPPATREQWRQLVDGVLKGRPFDKVLVTHLHDGIDLQPLYTADDLGDAATDARLGLPGSAPFVRGGSAVRNGWDVRQHHVVADPATANEAVLADLERGATSVWLRSSPDDLARVLDGVYLDLAAVVLDPGPAFVEGADALRALWEQRDIAPSAAIGGFGADPVAWGVAVDPAVALAVRAADEMPGVRAFTVDGTVWHEAGASDVEELSLTIATGIGYLRELTAAGLDVATAAAQIEFRYATSADQFSGIAKLRAARRLWARVTEVSGATQPQVQHAVSSGAMMTRRDPWVNMLRTTVACFAAAVGGADAITVAPFDAAIGASDDLGRRIARNTQALLLDEAYVARVADPAGGSWYVEHLTADFARSAWGGVQALERANGVAAALDSGMVGELLEATWAERSAAIARRKDPITGVSEFPDISEAPVVRPPAPEPAPAVVPRRRYAEGFEDLRDRAESTGVRPTIFLANLGPVAVHTARSMFAKNFFESGGIAALGNDGFDSPIAAANAFVDSGATIACLCSSDAVYDERAESAALALRDAGARRVYLAGRRETPGVDEHVYAGCDAIAVLRTALDTALGDAVATTTGEVER